MKDTVVVTLADTLYLGYAKQLFSAAFWNAGWQGDYLLLAHEANADDTRWFSEKGIIVKFCKALPIASDKKVDIILASKLYLFTDYFKQWKRVIFLDLDIIIRGPIDGLCDVDGFGACTSLGSTLKDNLIDFENIDPALLAEINSHFDLYRNAFNSGVMSFDSEIIGKSIFNELLNMFNKYIKVARYGDQLILNLCFSKTYKEMLPVYNRIIEKSEYANINPSHAEGIIIHTVSMGDGPWNPDNIFHDEWKNNFDKADHIDLSHIPQVRPWSQKEIQQQSRKIVSEHFVGQKFGKGKIFNSLSKVLHLITHDPKKAAVKIKQFIEASKTMRE
jgi:lipopolysaccharide biosynthesis glycosyltransferase